MLNKLVSADFEPYRDQTFKLYTGYQDVVDPLEVVLTGVTVLGPAPVRDGVTLRAPFSLIFRGPQGIRLPQRIYRLEQPQLGTLEIFLVPVGPDSTGLCYEAIFN